MNLSVRTLEAPTALPICAHPSRGPSSVLPRNSFNTSGLSAPAPEMPFDPSPSPHSPALSIWGCTLKPMSWASLIYPKPRNVPCTQGWVFPWISCSWLGLWDVTYLLDPTLTDLRHSYHSPLGLYCSH